VWVADITYLRSWEGWLYLVAVQDLYSRRIVGWSMADHMRADLVVDALNMAIARRRPEAGLIHHSDQGSQFELNRSSQHRVFGELTVAGDGTLAGSSSVGWLSSRRLTRRAGRSGDSHARGRPGPCVGREMVLEVSGVSWPWRDARLALRLGFAIRASCGAGR
jgi:hypothetical protein